MKQEPRIGHFLDEEEALILLLYDFFIEEARVTV